jgi:ribosomal protein S7
MGLLTNNFNSILRYKHLKIFPVNFIKFILKKKQNKKKNNKKLFSFVFKRLCYRRKKKKKHLWLNNKIGFRALLKCLFTKNLKIHSKKLNFFAKKLIFFDAYLEKKRVLRESKFNLGKKKIVIKANQKNEIFNKHLLNLYKITTKNKNVVPVKVLRFLILRSRKYLFGHKDCDLLYYIFFRELITQITKFNFSSEINKTLQKACFLLKFKEKKNIYNNNLSTLLYNKLIGLILKKGKAKKIVSGSLKIACKILKISLKKLFFKLSKRLKTLVESKKIKIRRTSHFVPFSVNKRRRTFLMCKWILLSIQKNKNLKKIKKKRTLIYKLSNEIVTVIKDKKSLPNKMKKKSVFIAMKNRSNAHFRW